MKHNYYVYNNEALSSCILLAILQKAGNIDLARGCLILPMLLDDKTVKCLGRNIDTDATLQEIIESERKVFVTYSKRYASLLPIFVNSVMILSKGRKIRIEGESIRLYDFKEPEMNLGERYKSILMVIPYFLELTNKYTTPQLYKTLSIQL